MTNTPLNPDAIDRVARALMEDAGYRWGNASEQFRDGFRHHARVALAAAQPEVNSVEELDALPIGTVVYANNHIGPAERFNVGWMGCGNTAAWSSAVLAGDGLPARVLYLPEVTK